MPTITKEHLIAELEKVTQQRQQLIADLNACDGAEQMLQKLLVDIENCTEKEPAS